MRWYWAALGWLSLVTSAGCMQGIQFGALERGVVEIDGAGAASSALSFCGNVRGEDGNILANVPVDIVSDSGEVIATVQTDENGVFTVTVNTGHLPSSLYVKAASGEMVQVAIVETSALILAAASPASPAALEIASNNACGKADVTVDPDANREALRVCLEGSCPTDLWGGDPAARAFRTAVDTCGADEERISCLVDSLLTDQAYRIGCRGGDREDSCEVFEQALSDCPQSCPSFGCSQNLTGTWYAATTFRFLGHTLITATFRDGGPATIAYDSDAFDSSADVSWSYEENVLELYSLDFCGADVSPSLFDVTFDGCDCFETEMHPPSDDGCGFSFHKLRFCKTISVPESKCYDGADDDGDGLTDCQDPDCAEKACTEDGCSLCQVVLGEGQGGGEIIGGDFFIIVDGDLGGGPPMMCMAQQQCVEGGGGGGYCGDGFCGQNEVCPQDCREMDCSNTLDDDGDTYADCLDTDCVNAIECQPPSEICTNGIEDDGDAAIDCDDADCASDSSCDSADSCCVVGTGPGCVDWAVRNCVCASDSYCCATQWDATCVNEVDSLSCGVCGP